MNPTFPTINHSAGWQRLLQQSLLREILQTAARVRGLAHDAVSFRSRATAIVDAIQDLRENNSRLAYAPAGRIAAFVLMWLAPLAACTADFVLLGSVLEFFARRIYDDAGMITVTRTIIPIVVVTVEMIISALRVHAHEQALEAGRMHAHWTWHLFPLLMIVPLPTLVVATNLAAAATMRTGTFDLVLKLQIIGLVALSAAMHAIILYGGQLAADARGYFFFKLGLWRRNRSYNRLHSLFESAIKELSNGYARHTQAVDEYNQESAAHLSYGPFDLITRELLGDVFGDPDQTVVEFPSRIDAA